MTAHRPRIADGHTVWLGQDDPARKPQLMIVDNDIAARGAVSDTRRNQGYRVIEAGRRRHD